MRFCGQFAEWMERIESALSKISQSNSMTLQQHIKTGDPDDPSFKGHPECEFCRQNFYSSDEIFEHCREKHETCHICRQNGIKDQYYQDYHSLEGHFEEDHFLCKDAVCLEKKFVVFATDLDFKAHITAEHGSKMSKDQLKQTRRIDIEIKYTNTDQQQRTTSTSKKGRRRQDAHAGTSSIADATQQLESRENSSQKSRSERESNILSKPLRPPPGFGGTLTSETNNILVSPASKVPLAPIGDSSLPIEKEEWPTIGAGQQQELQSKRSLEITELSLFEDSDIKGTLRQLLLGDPRLKRQEELICPQVADAIRFDFRKWSIFRSLCINYLKGIILAEKFYDQFFMLLGAPATQHLYRGVVDVFPETMRPPLLRVFNDKRAFKDPFPALESTQLPAYEGGSYIAGKSTEQSAATRARVLVIKSQPRHTFNQAKVWKSDRNSQGAGSIKKKEEITAGYMSETFIPQPQTDEFPALPSAQTKGKSKKQQKALLLSTTLPITNGSEKGNGLKRAPSFSVDVAESTLSDLKLSSEEDHWLQSSTGILSKDEFVGGGWVPSAKSARRQLTPSTEFPALPAPSPKPKNVFLRQITRPSATDSSSSTTDKPPNGKKGKHVVLRLG